MSSERPIRAKSLPRPVATASRCSSPDVEAFRRCVAPVRARVTYSDGWPTAPGRYGRLEWRGLEASGEALLYAFTNRVKLIARLRAVAGVRPKQTGDREAVVSFRADDTAALAAVTRLLKIQRRAHRPDAAQRLRNARRAPLQRENPALETTRNPADDPEERQPRLNVIADEFSGPGGSARQTKRQVEHREGSANGSARGATAGRCERQVQMARRLGIGRSTLNRLEMANQNTTITTLDTLCRALRCDIADLFPAAPPKKSGGRRRRSG